MVSISPNLVEAQDLFAPGAVAVDTSTNPPALYVADTGNNRVLGWRNASALSNGQAADIVVGQRDFNSTLSQGPNTTLTVGLSSPVAVAVDPQGNLYVTDGGNNRVLRYPRPFQQTDVLKQPDMVLGQPNFTTRDANNGGLSERSISTLFGNGVLRSGLLFDPNGNLWFSDSGNNRVLRYAREVLQAGRNQPAANAVLGQASFTTRATAPSDPRVKNLLNQPSSLAFDTSGRLYVCDVLMRVMVYASPANLALADRVMGVVVLQPGQPVPAAVNDISLGRRVGSANRPPEGVFFTGGTPYVVDTANNRVLRFDPYESWPPESTQFSPTARQVIGQADFTAFRANRNQPEPNALGFDDPLSAVVAAGNVFLVDSGNHRVMIFPVQNGSFTQASRVIGQNEFHQGAPNNMDGRELFLFAGLVTIGSSNSSDGAGVAVDTSSSPPRLYISDTYNNRILCYRDARSVKQGDRADLVIGQRDLTRSLINDPSNDPDQLTETGLRVPANVTVDAAGNLYIADSGNGRVLRYPRPFDQQGPLRPDLVLGQSSFFTKLTDATARTMARPYGMAFTQAGHLMVSDLIHNRVLFFRKPEGGDFTSGMAADKVIGQSDFNSITASNLPNRMVAPHGIATDTDDRLYVADTGNNRLLVYDTIVFADPDPFPALTLPGFNSPHGVFVSPSTGQIWVADTGNNRVLRFPVYIEMFFGSTISDFGFTTRLPLALTLDASNNLLIADGNNRVTMHFPSLRATNGGHQLSRLAPYTHTTLRPTGFNRFAESTINFKDESGATSMPTALGDLEVLVGNVNAPVQMVSPEKIEIVIPQSVAPSNSVPIVIQRLSTGSIVAAGTLVLAQAAPSLFTVSGDGAGQVMAKNPSGTANSASDRVGRGEVVSLFGTGFGAPSGLPQDGQPAADKMDATGSLQVAMGTALVPRDNIQYFGLAPGLIAVWQIDVKVPDNVPPDPNVNVSCIYNSIQCNQDAGVRRITTMAVKPSAAPESSQE
ncbi:MAG: hypothetical protein JNK48_28685 [Bryobacterales bacterium]|nr:hypothetical protein [Bryobacterales bacterium]